MGSAWHGPDGCEREIAEAKARIAELTAKIDTLTALPPAVDPEVIKRLDEWLGDAEGGEPSDDEQWLDDRYGATCGDLRAVLRVAAIVTEQQMFPMVNVVGEVIQ